MYCQKHNTPAVYCLYIDQDNAHYLQKEFIHFLSDYKKSQFEALRYSINKVYCLIGDITAKIILGRYLGIDASCIVLDETIHKKPYLKNKNINLYFNISHSEKYIVIAIDKMNTGVDIEFIGSDSFYPEEAADIFMNKYELKKMDSLNDKEKKRYYYHTWTIKESILKFYGTGLLEDPKKIDTSNFDIKTGYLTEPICNISKSLDSYLHIYTSLVSKNYSLSLTTLSKEKPIYYEFPASTFINKNNSLFNFI